jgi:hypothetical protein
MTAGLAARLGPIGIVTAIGALLVARLAVADADPSTLMADGAKALHDGRASDAITAFESLADQGVVDAVASYDRGLAYAARVRIGAEVPGDLGRAAHGFEEARDLTRDPKLADDATTALTVLRSEVARRRTQAGQSVEVDPGRSLGRTVAGLLPEDTWAVLAMLASATLAIGLFTRSRTTARRPRVGAGVAAGLAAPLLVISVLMTLSARHDRLSLREAIVVSPSARPSDEHGLVAPGATPLPEGARVELVEGRAMWTRVRFGALDAWVPTSTLREIAR